MAGILERGKDRLQGAALVLGPQTELPLLRQTLNEIGYRIRRERAVEANRRGLKTAIAAARTWRRDRRTDDLAA